MLTWICPQIESEQKITDSRFPKLRLAKTNIQSWQCFTTYFPHLGQAWDHGTYRGKHIDQHWQGPPARQTESEYMYDNRTPQRYHNEVPMKNSWRWHLSQFVNTLYFSWVTAVTTVTVEIPVGFVCVRPHKSEHVWMTCLPVSIGLGITRGGCLGSKLYKSNYVSLPLWLSLQPGLSVPDNLLWQSTIWPPCFKLPIGL